jgi:hypothetical protein
MKMMPKLLIAVVVMVVAARGSEAQRVRAATVPEAVRSGFERKYPYANGIRWAKDRNSYEASFRESGTGYLVSFSLEGRCQEIAERVSKKELPSNARATIDSSFAKARILEVAVITREGARFYKVLIKQKRKEQFVLIDAQGRFLPGQRRRSSL